VLALIVIIADLITSKRGFLQAITLIGLVVPTILSVLLWNEVRVQGGSTEQIVGIFGSLVVDKFSLFFKFLFIAILALVVLASRDYSLRFPRAQGEYYALMLVSACGMMLLASTTELISIYIALELTTIPLIALSALLRDQRSSEAGIKFLLLGALSSAFLLYGMVFIYGLTGTTQIYEIGEVVRVLAQSDVTTTNYALFLGLVLIIAGLAFKISAVPFHMWVPDVYEGAPTPITAYLSVASKAAGFAILIRILSIGFGALAIEWGLIIAVISAISMTVGNLVAIAQSNIKRLLAYSTIAHAGYLLIGIAAIAHDGSHTMLGISGILFYLVAYAATNLAAFFAIMIVSAKTGSEKIEEFAGIGRTSPWIAFALTLSMVSLIGLPPTVGFIAKLYIFNAAISNGLLWLVLIGVVNSVLSAYYYLRVVRVMYFVEAPSDNILHVPKTSRFALAIVTIAIIMLGLLPTTVLNVAETAGSIVLP
ncbi:MAG: NADH-quinone oxidoreductase subunit N, partial [Anaerolineales bacterium]|nr:NADH-quinone oxidoreductase subunit N [Anaerolineales bacterium]